MYLPVRRKSRLKNSELQSTRRNCNSALVFDLLILFHTEHILCRFLIPNFFRKFYFKYRRLTFFWFSFKRHHQPLKVKCFYVQMSTLDMDVNSFSVVSSLFPRMSEAWKDTISGKYKNCMNNFWYFFSKKMCVLRV